MDFQITARTLHRRIVLETDEPGLHTPLRWLRCDPVMEVPRETYRIGITAYRGRFRIDEPQRDPREKLTTGAVLTWLERRLFERAVEDAPGAPLLHAASLTHEGRRVLMMGAEPIARAALAVRLCLEGMVLEGVGGVFVVGRDVVSRPCPVHLTEKSLQQQPGLEVLLADASVADDSSGRRIYSVDPAAIGKHWSIRQGAVDAVVLLRPNQGGASSIRTVPPGIAVREALAGAMLPDSGRAAAVPAVAMLLGSVRAFDLSLGDHAEAARCIRAALDRPC
jgi:hypothetical protein